MTGDDDLTRLLPEPPPPRPARREAAIALALQRFDGNAAPHATVDRPPSAPPRRRRTWGPIGALASLLIVAMISIPIALREPEGPWTGAERPSTAEAPASQATRPPAAAKQPNAAAGEEARTPSPPASPPAAAPKVAEEVAPADVEGPRGPAVAPAPAGEPAAPAPEPPARRAAARAAANAEEREVVVTGTRILRPMLDSPSPVTVVSEAELDQTITVTGAQRKGSRAALRRGDWNACTVNDPARSLDRCRSVLRTGRGGARGEAATHLSDGLTLAWQQDWRGAIERFDRAIALRPRLAFAWLNRGLAYQHLGDLDRAAADLDRAVRLAGQSARAYYHRGVVRRLRGDARGAKADMAQAEALDPRYQAVID